MFPELKEIDDEEILEELKAKKNTKDFDAIINRKKLNRFELDQAMAEA